MSYHKPASENSRSLSIGREAGNDFIVDAPMVSGFHARIVVENGNPILEDLGSSNGTYVGECNERIDRKRISESDIVFLGSYEVAARELLSALQKGRSANSERAIVVSHGDILLGRDPDCDQVLDSPLVSWHHARIRVSDDRMEIQDLGSTNGTFVNGIRIGDWQRLHPEDLVSLGGNIVEVSHSGELGTRAFQADLTLEARRLGVVVPGARLLDGISITIKSGEFVGLMGPSGAGKSTLMNALNGYALPTSGKVLLSGRDFYENYDQYRGQIGFVPQDDIMHGDLTVRQALYYTARLRLPRDYSVGEIDLRIHNTLQQLGLEGTEDVLIGSPEKKGISGGQRKRVNLAMELLTDPSLLFLDEPTSGLSSEDAMTVMKLLRQLADQGKTILLTIHQPSLEAYRLLDHLTVVAKNPGSRDPGTLAYFGPAYPDAIEYFSPHSHDDRNAQKDRSPDEVLRGLGTQPAAHWAEKYDRSTYRRNLVQKRRIKKDATPANKGGGKKSRAPLLLQTLTLCSRCARVKLTDKWNTTLLLVQAPIIAALIVLVFGEKAAEAMTNENWPEVAKATSTTVFLLSLAAIWLGCSNSAREIVSEWAIYRRERMVNLTIPAYISSKFVVLGVICAIQCLILLVIVYWGNGLQGPWGLYLGILFLAASVGIGLGLAISSLARTSEVAIAILPLVIIPMVILGGVLQPVNEMGTVSKGLSYLMPSRWAFESLLVLEAGERDKWLPPTLPATLPAPVTANTQQQEVTADMQEAQPTEMESPTEHIDLAEEFFPDDNHRHDFTICCGWLGIMLVTAIGTVSFVLLRRDLH